MSYVIAILVFGLLIFVHELGHFVVAKLSGIAVLQFTIGFGPAIFKKKIGGTVYALRALPLGGAVMMQGEGDDETEALLTGKTAEAAAGEDNAPRGIPFSEAPLWKRFLVCVAGAAMNFLSGVLILFILMLPVQYRADSTITGFMDGFQYSGEDGFQVGDKIVKINGFTIYTNTDLGTALMLGKDEAYDITVVRDGERVKLQDLPLTANIYSEEDGTYKYGFFFQSVEMGLGGKLGYGFKTSMTYLQSAVASIKMLIGGQAGAGDMMGTVGIANEISNMAKQNMRVMWNFVAYISINLAFVNLLPIPALDGGKLLFMLVELVRGKPIDPKYEGTVNLIGMGLILLLFVFVTYQDIARLIGG